MHVYVKSARSEAEDTAQREEDVVVGFIMGGRSWASQGRGVHHAYYDNTRKENNVAESGGKEDPEEESERATD